MWCVFDSSLNRCFLSGGVELAGLLPVSVMAVHSLCIIYDHSESVCAVGGRGITRMHVLYCTTKSAGTTRFTCGSPPRAPLFVPFVIKLFKHLLENVKVSCRQRVGVEAASSVCVWSFFPALALYQHYCSSY